jgi:L-Lysine epsilon oxidase N-terminal/L-lysine epsilon oxidase C-terminal domain
MFVNIVQSNRIKLGQDPARRPVFLKPHGVAHGRFEVRPNLPENLKIGVFAMSGFPAWVRFSSDSQPTDPDLKTTLGVGIKLFGVPGDKLLGDGDTHDFILQNFDIFFVDTVKDMCEFTRAGVVEGSYKPYLKSHPVTKEILDEMKKAEASVLTTTYWSVLPYALGEQQFAKYKLEPETPPDSLPFDDPDYLALDMAQRLLAREARFKFMVQLRTDPKTMPLDQATVRWDESQSQPIHVATLILPQQDINGRGQAAYGENLAFNAWHCLKEHAPQGSISEARKVVYAASADERRDANGVPVREPGPPRPDIAVPNTPDECIVKAAIHPSIGIARVGNSKEEWFLAPEVTYPPAMSPGFYRDASGALKRQAPRFRIYGLNAEGKVVKELTLANAKIAWTVHLANKKAAWYQFQLALDIPEAASALPTLLRNSWASDRATLVIDPGPLSISGRDQGGSSHTFDAGKFMGTTVYLGELRTDKEGRLIVLGGRGKSASCDGSRAVTFANNEGWYDDTSDGPVTADVEFEGKKLEVAPAWIVVAPPNYAPLQKSVRTMWDLMRDGAIQAGTLPAPARPSFNKDIRPLFERLSGLQWVNAGFAATFGFRGPNNFDTVEWLSRFNDKTPDDREMRHTIADQFRVWDRDSWSPIPWPWNYGDAMNIPPAETPRQNVALTDTQLKFLQQWSAGDFDSDYVPGQLPPRTIEEVSVSEQAEMLDRASLEFCLADAFHPGCEMTWPMRSPMMYMAPFRIKHAKPKWIEPQYGPSMTQDVTSLPNGPLAAQVPGGITRWMAVPWQTDTASCRSGYLKTYDPYIPSFWAARVPNQVLTGKDYEIVMDKTRPLGERLAAFANRAAWTRILGSKSYTHQINNMVKHYGDMGVVEQRSGPGANFPDVMQVEDLPQHAIHQLSLSKEPPHASDRIDLTGIEKVRRFPYGLKR